MKKLLIKLFVVSMTVLCVTPFGFRKVHAEHINKEVELVEIVSIDILDPAKRLEKNIKEYRIAKAKRELEEKKRKEEEERRKQEEERLRQEELERQRIASLPIEEKIRLACDRYSVDYQVVLAIARLETGWFKSSAYLYRNNPGGLSRNEQPLYFSTIEEGVEAFVSNLKYNYFDQGLDSPSEIGSKYCPINPQWAVMVESLMKFN
jgi:hypothetical protein